ncbi:MAG TPA: transposase [Flavobacteriaceae bacterium]|jgi:transposase|nr:transposase [Flavobacteriaceae bacterium]
MGLQSKLVIKESLSELRLLQSKQRNIKSEKRILCLILLKSKKFKTQGEVAEYLGVCRQSIVAWLSKYRLLGISGIVISPTRNKQSKIISSKIHQGLSKKVKDSKNPFLGYWDAQRWVMDNYNVEIQYHWLRVYMIKHFKTKLKSPRKSHYKKDDKAVNAFLKTP